MKHTRGRWGFADRNEVCAIDSDQLNNGYVIAIFEGPDRNENAKRVVACVNACDGIPESVLSVFTQAECNILVSNGLANEQLKKVTEERDSLLCALKYHQDQTRPIQSTIDLLAKHEVKP